MQPSQTLTDKQRRIVVALGETLFPSTGEGDPCGSEVLPEAFDEFLPTLAADKRKELGKALALFDFVSIFRHGKRFSNLSLDRRAQYLERWMRSRIALCRIIYRALRETCALLYYQDRRTWPAIGYSGPPVSRDR